MEALGRNKKAGQRQGPVGGGRPKGVWPPRPGLAETGCVILRTQSIGLLDRRSSNAILTTATDLLILGLGPAMRPLSPDTKRHIASLGMRVEVLDTRNAAAQFNLLATERGVADVAAALIPIGWEEGIGA